MQKRNTTIDFFKYIASLLVVGIHTALFSDVNDTVYFVVVQIVCRMAVPFFAICTGYFLARKLKKGELLRDENSKRIFYNQWKKLIALYIVWTIVYLFYSIPGWINIGWFSWHAFLDYGIASIFVGSHYHLWYLLSAIYALPVLYFLVRFVSLKYFMPIAGLLWCFKALMYGYRTWVPPQVAEMFTLMDKVSGIRDAVFCIVPLMLAGVSIGINKSKTRRHDLAGFCISFVLLMIEAFSLRYGNRTDVSFIVFTLPSAYFLFRLILVSHIRLNSHVCKICGAVSLFVYCIHPMIAEMTDTQIHHTILHFIVVAVIATGTGLLYEEGKQRIGKRKDR